MKKVVGEYVLISEIGSGATGPVYLATQHNDANKYFAIKVLARQSFIQTSPLLEKIYNHDYNVLSQINYLHVLPIINILKTPNNYYVVMPYCEGGNLLDTIKRKTFYSEVEALKVIAQILSAIKVLQLNKIQVTDFKLSNVLLKGNTVTLSCLGFAKLGHETFRSQSAEAAYFAPEQLFNQLLFIPEKAESLHVWFLGLCLYQLLYGQLPYTLDQVDGQSIVGLEQLIAQKTGKNINFPEHHKVTQNCQNLLKSMLEKDSSARITFDNIMQHEVFQQIKDFKIFNVLDSQIDRSVIVDSKLQQHSHTKIFNESAIKLPTANPNQTNQPDSKELIKLPVYLNQSWNRYLISSKTSFTGLNNNHVEYSKTFDISGCHIFSVIRIFTVTMKEVRKLAKFLICDIKTSAKLAYVSALLLVKSLTFLDFIKETRLIKDADVDKLEREKDLQEKYLKHVTSNFFTEFDSKDFYKKIRYCSTERRQKVMNLDKEIHSIFVELKGDLDSFTLRKEWKEDLSLVLLHIYYCMKAHIFFPKINESQGLYSWEIFETNFGTLKFCLEDEFNNKPL